MRAPFLCAALAAAPVAATADSMTFANNLGTVIGSEAFCGLSYDQAAIETYIADHAPTDDMSFPGMLTMMVQGTEYGLKDLSTSARTAHCAAVTKAARNFGFLK